MLIAPFLLATVALILQGILIPRLSLLAFSPFLALVVLRCEFVKMLGLSLCAGCLIDLVSEDPMGLHALNYTITTAILFRIRSAFDADQPLHLSCFTALISCVSTGLQWILLFLFDKKIPFEGKWFLVDLLAMPVLDALYAFVWFAAPLTLFNYLYKKWRLKKMEKNHG